MQTKKQLLSSQLQTADLSSQNRSSNVEKQAVRDYEMLRR